MRMVLGAGAILASLLIGEPGAAAPLQAVPSAAQSLPVLKTGVLCGSRGCQPVTRFRRCWVKHTPLGQRRVCNF